ncbi:MAG: hypothetical protein LLG20_12390 [Acidobacteriales bacterium]|nr:hypothetical protein [Terriglobales bacterium]
MKRIILFAAMMWTASSILDAQAARPSNVVGTVVAIRAEPLEIQVKDDKGRESTAKLDATTEFRKVAPGERNLRNAQVVEISSVSPGDRVLITLAADGVTARRVVVMSAQSISSRNEADREDWQARGAAGIVDNKKDGTIVLRMHSMTGESHVTVAAGPKTVFRQYAPGSVKFADAKISSVNAVAVGDQLRARGTKSADGSSVQAEEVVFGTFLTRAGQVVRTDAAAGVIVMKGGNDGKLLTVRITPDSQLKRMPAFPSGAGGPGPMPQGNRAGGPPDFTHMIERLPGARIEEIQTGETIVVSSTREPRPDQLTAIMLLSNADFLVRMAAARAARASGAGSMNGGRGMQQDTSMGLGGLSNGLGGIELPGMLQ